MLFTDKQKGGESWIRTPPNAQKQINQITQMNNMNLSRFDGKNGIEIFIDTVTGISATSISGYSRMSGKNKSTISRRLKGVAPGEQKTTEFLTPGGLQGVVLVTEDLIAEWLPEDNPAMATVLIKVGVRTMLHDLAGYKVTSLNPTTGQSISFENVLKGIKTEIKHNEKGYGKLSIRGVQRLFDLGASTLITILKSPKHKLHQELVLRGFNPKNFAVNGVPDIALPIIADYFEEQDNIYAKHFTSITKQIGSRVLLQQIAGWERPGVVNYDINLLISGMEKLQKQMESIISDNQDLKNQLGSMAGTNQYLDENFPGMSHVKQSFCDSTKSLPPEKRWLTIAEWVQVFHDEYSHDSTFKKLLGRKVSEAFQNLTLTSNKSRNGSKARLREGSNTPEYHFTCWAILENSFQVAVKYLG